MTNTRAEKIESLRARLAQLEAAEKAAEARNRAVASKRARQDDTRRKILIGAYVLDRLQLEGVSALELRGVSFVAWLTRAADRELFGLAPLCSHSPEATILNDSSRSFKRSPRRDFPAHCHA